MKTQSSAVVCVGLIYSVTFIVIITVDSVIKVMRTMLLLVQFELSVLLRNFIIRSTCNSRDTLLAEALIYRLRGHYVGLRRKSGLIRYIRADITTYIAYISPDIANQPAVQILRNWY